MIAAANVPTVPGNKGEKPLYPPVARKIVNLFKFFPALEIIYFVGYL